MLPNTFIGDQDPVCHSSVSIGSIEQSALASHRSKRIDRSQPEQARCRTGAGGVGVGVKGEKNDDGCKGGCDV
jgi:hypothetical protein